MLNYSLEIRWKEWMNSEIHTLMQLYYFIVNCCNRLLSNFLQICGVEELNGCTDRPVYPEVFSKNGPLKIAEFAAFAYHSSSFRSAFNNLREHALMSAILLLPLFSSSSICIHCMYASSEWSHYDVHRLVNKMEQNNSILRWSAEDGWRRIHWFFALHSLRN